MTEFEKWLCKNYGKLMDGTSFEYNTKESWKAALKWVLNHRKPYYDINDKKVVATDSDIIYNELEQQYNE